MRRRDYRIIERINRQSERRHSPPPMQRPSPPGWLRAALLAVGGVLAVFFIIGLLLPERETADGPGPAVRPTPPVTPGSRAYAPSEPGPDRAVTEGTDGEPAPPPGDLELPVAGATGYASVRLNVTADAGLTFDVAAVMEPGTAFLILREENDRWLVRADGVQGWVRHAACMVNLPDVAPSIVYDCTNAYASRFRTSGMAIPGVTGEALYEARGYNARLGRQEFTVPVLYATAKRVCRAQQNALAEGDTLILYEAFRPYAVQHSVALAVETLARENRDVWQGINAGAWELTWFISTGTSNHQRGGAIDAGLARVTDTETAAAGTFPYTRVSAYDPYEPPTPIHELSILAAMLTRPVDSASADAWRNVPLSPGMAENTAAQNLQRYCTDAGLVPLASEWWHFNDLDTLSRVFTQSDGDFFIGECLSVPPDEAQGLGAAAE